MIIDEKIAIEVINRLSTTVLKTIQRTQRIWRYERTKSSSKMKFPATMISAARSNFGG